MTEASPDRRPQCPNCGKRFEKLKDGKIPTHDYPPPCRAVCRGAGRKPKPREETPLWKDDPEQEIRDFEDGCRSELLLYGFAVVKEVASLRAKPSGQMACPLCRAILKYSVAPNGHVAVRCPASFCLNMME